MLASNKIKIVEALVDGLSREETIWLSGYFSGLVSDGKVFQTKDNSSFSHLLNETVAAKNFSSTNVTAAQAAAPLMTQTAVTLVYGTETGNAKRLATHLAARGKKEGVHIKLAALDQYRLSDLPNEEKFLVIISTHGEGEPPAGAKKFYDHLFQQAQALPNMQYAVLALGDSSYPLFCKTGEDVDAQLHKLQAKSLAPVQKCDLDYEEDAERWFGVVLQSLQQVAPPVSAATVVATPKSKTKIIYQGRVLNNINLNGRGSDKTTYHIEIAAEALQYEPGDSIGIVPKNRKEVVDEIIQLTGVDGEKEVVTEKHTASVYELLTTKLNICYLLTSTVKAYAALTGQNIPDTRMNLKDLLRIYPLRSREQFINVLQLLKPVAPRLYSISSSPSAHYGEVHITVAKHHFLLEDEQHFGLCSQFLGDLPPGAHIDFYIHKNRAFKLPASDKDIIMIGPGTGIAPFRSFIAERDAVNASGRSWLFFGDQHFTTDFNYQTEWQAWLSTGALTKMNVVFSRDQTEKVYVQHKMQQHAAEFFEWLKSGAYLYVCGAKQPMGNDVEQAVLQIIRQQTQSTEADALNYLQQLKAEGRYQKDLY